MIFEQHLMDIGFEPQHYLSMARESAKANGYDPSKIQFSKDGVHKLEIITPDNKIVKFGRNLYGDFIIWSFLEHHKVADKGYAKMKRNIFQKSHGKMQELLEERKGAKQPYSANELALKILW
jgi:hypothetical protein